MAIEIKSSSNEIDILFTNSINRIFTNVDESFLENIHIVITDLGNIPRLFPSNAIPNEYHLYKRILANSFGITQPKYFIGGDRKHLLVINIQNIQSLRLIDSELDAVIAHELGHILNAPENGIEDYSNHTEFYADYFAKSLHFKDDLLSSIEKYLKQDNATNIDLFQLRIEKLNSDEIYNGIVKAL
ncbi:hypothetical protein [Flavobacterium ginsenosidimutans]|uniref:Peptidase M48 domain-containing protein n=1 Tax=Flavobacterium ginsenosidimutans TaxID=687844 RepID=A0ABZ2QAH6_9FLAO